MRLQSHAKINLWLRVLGKRTDGFHEVETLMLPIGLADEIVLENHAESRIEFACDDPALPTDSRNLARRAAELFRERCAPARGARIRLAKRIPLGAGLGGGSSNAATVLVGLNRLWETARTDGEIEKLAAEIGSDAAFFVKNRPALCAGRGERLAPVVSPRAQPLLLAHFGFGSATAWAYHNLGAGSVGASRRAAPKEFEIARRAFLSGKTDPLAPDLLLNDLEKPVYRKFPILEIAKEFLLAQTGVRGAMMSGSGSTLFALLTAPEAAEELVRALRAHFGENVWTWSGVTLDASADDLKRGATETLRDCLPCPPLADSGSSNARC
ncbi:MAG: 4-(cytidine 5'-diphospho)-2-C-methyl-D-erythritol kinase [Verrucomicrobiae bacterium]|nr:4-(cytidine 5'-diphospho)-2-C-methyl-D-erythritol kinase [Verrucomicrobiae bacterium]